MGRSIQEWTRRNLWKRAFKKLEVIWTLEYFILYIMGLQCWTKGVHHARTYAYFYRRHDFVVGMILDIHTLTRTLIFSL